VVLISRRMFAHIGAIDALSQRIEERAAAVALCIECRSLMLSDELGGKLAPTSGRGRSFRT
jgi:hypothetical protein